MTFAVVGSDATLQTAWLDNMKNPVFPDKLSAVLPPSGDVFLDVAIHDHDFHQHDELLAKATRVALDDDHGGSASGTKVVMAAGEARPEERTLLLSEIKAFGVPDASGVSDPYVKFKLVGEEDMRVGQNQVVGQDCRTSHKNNETDPVFPEKLWLHLPQFCSGKLQVVWDHDFNSGDELLAVAIVELQLPKTRDELDEDGDGLVDLREETPIHHVEIDAAGVGRFSHLSVGVSLVYATRPAPHNLGRFPDIRTTFDYEVDEERPDERTLDATAGARALRLLAACAVVAAARAGDNKRARRASSRSSASVWPSSSRRAASIPTPPTPAPAAASRLLCAHAGRFAKLYSAYRSADGVDADGLAAIGSDFWLGRRLPRRRRRPRGARGDGRRARSRRCSSCCCCAAAPTTPPPSSARSPSRTAPRSARASSRAPLAAAPLPPQPLAQGLLAGLGGVAVLDDAAVAAQLAALLDGAGEAEQRAARAAAAAAADEPALKPPAGLSAPVAQLVRSALLDRGGRRRRAGRGAAPRARAGVPRIATRRAVPGARCRLLPLLARRAPPRRRRRARRPFVRHAAHGRRRRRSPPPTRAVRRGVRAGRRRLPPARLLARRLALSRAPSPRARAATAARTRSTSRCRSTTWRRRRRAPASPTSASACSSAARSSCGSRWRRVIRGASSWRTI